MARYIDADKFREKAFFADTEADINHYIRLYGYADVVPKSEVERLTKIIDLYELLYGTVRDKHTVVEKAKQEVARDIITDMREMIKGYENIDIYLDRIEKKYTEREG